MNKAVLLTGHRNFVPSFRVLSGLIALLVSFRDTYIQIWMLAYG
jgi:membrane-bound metal-dependent hydrolase YbcI (DUF457 family)